MKTKPKIIATAFFVVALLGVFITPLITVLLNSRSNIGNFVGVSLVIVTAYCGYLTFIKLKNDWKKK